MLSDLSRILFGNPLPTAEEAQHRLSKVVALAVFSSDALSSVAYATEEILIVLVIGGTAALGFSLPVSLAIAALLIIVAASYYQTIHAYPSGGGAYTVARENLGIWPGLTAAAGLLIGYVLTVAVSIAAGIAAITSALPALLPFRVHLGLLAILVVAWANLRGVRESGRLFAIPTYSFVLMLLLLVGVGLVRIILGTLHVASGGAMSSVGQGVGSVGPWVILRAFASGCAALTGVEAISNGIPAFEKPEPDNAGKTLIAMAALLTTMFLGLTFLVQWLQLVPLEDETIVSQTGRLVLGGGPLYLFLQAATMLILLLAANTSFAGFPRLAAILARARYLPSQMTNIGDRLVFNNGIIALALLASGLIVIFGGETHRLIPLYALGVFLSFTLSQTGMVQHWRRAGGQGWQWKTAVNGLGATATGVVTLVIAATKFVYGAWIVVLLIPAIVWVCQAMYLHYRAVAEQLSLDNLRPEKWEGLASRGWDKVVVPISGMHRGTLSALRFARTLSTDVTAVVVDVDPQVTTRVQDKWPMWGGDIPLAVLESPYRSTLQPLLTFLDEVDRRDPERGLAVVVLPEFVPARWWHHLLHNQTAFMIKTVLVYQRGRGGKDRVIINVPYHLQR